MTTQALEPPLTIEAVFLQLSQTNSFIRAVASLVLSNTKGKNLSEIADRVGAHSGTSMKATA